MQARGVQVHPKRLEVEGKVPQAVGSIHDAKGAVVPRKGGQARNRQEAAGEVDDLAHEHHAGARPQGGAVGLHDGVVPLLRARQAHDASADALAPLALAPGGAHPGVVLVRVDDLVSSLEVDPQLQQLEALRGVAHQRHILGPAAREPRQTRTHLGLPALLVAPQDLGRRAVRCADALEVRLLHGARWDAHAAVVEVGDGPIGCEGVGEGGPGLFVLRVARSPRKLAPRSEAGPCSQGRGERGAP